MSDWTREQLMAMGVAERAEFDAQVFKRVARRAEMRPEFGVQSEDINLAFEVANYRIHDAFGWINPESTVVPPVPQGIHFASSIVMCGPGKGVGIHSHTTEEMFVVLKGRFLFIWGDNEQHQMVLDQFDTISFPGPVMRRFLNAGEESGYVLAVVGGGDPPLSVGPEDLLT